MKRFEINNAVARLNHLKSEMGSISEVNIVYNDVVLYFENGMTLTISDNEISYQSDEHIKCEKDTSFTFDSSWGEITCDSKGNVINIDGHEEIDGERSYLYDIVRFDMDEYKKFCDDNGLTHGEALDMLCVGYWKQDGEFAEPDHEWRKETFGSVAMKYEVEKIFINLITNIGIDLPENWEDIVQFIYEDVMETADNDNWNDDDVRIGFRRWIENNG